MAVLHKINQDNLRAHNLSVVMSTLLASHVPLSRADIAKSSGLTKAAMSLLSEILLKNDVIRQLKPSNESTYGRPSTPLQFNPRSWAGIGLQINTDGYGYTVLDLAGGAVRTEWIAEPMIDVAPEQIFDKLDRMVRPVEKDLKQMGYTVCGAGLALPGLVEGNTRLLIAKNLGWTNVDLTQFDVVRRLNAKADNEANLAALAQISGYAAHSISEEMPLDSSSSFIYISTDVGIGGAFVRDGQVIFGDHDFGGELGHVSVDWKGPKCSCGRHGCLEMYAGRRALVEAAGIATREESATTDSINQLLEAWKGGEPKAVLAIDRGLSAMVSVLASTVNILDIDTIVLGGFWSNFDEELAHLLERRIQSQVLGRESVNIRVLMPPVADHPSLTGAAATGLRQLIDHPMQFLEV
ncbi:MAG: ROK family protein [Bifidobacteriaceae bacterium]|jgi:predicted NBD/HSP70 family sugar kinase|nr:ROK family protein [Bifidobacteriaceae bacterium]